MKRYIKQIRNISMIIIGLSLIVPIIMILLYPDARQLPLLEEEAQVLTEDFYYMENGEKVDIELPESVPLIDGSCTIYSEIPKTVYDNEYLLVWVSQKNLTVVAGEEELYSFKAENYPSFLNLSGFHFHMIKVPESSAGQTLSVAMEPRLSGSDSTTFREIYYGTQAEIFRTIAKSYGLFFILSVAVCLSSLFIIFLSLAFRKFLGSSYSMLYLGLFSFMLSLWYIEQSRMQQFFISIPMIQSFLTYGNLMVIPIPLARFIGEVADKKDDKGLLLTQVISAAMWTFYMILQLLGITDLSSSNVPVTILYIAFGIYAIYLVIREVQSGNERLKTYLPAFASLVVFMIIEFIYRITIDNAPSFITQMGMLVFMYFITKNLITETLYKFKTANESTYYQKLALIDLPTGVNNSTAYYRYTEEYIADKTSLASYCLIAFDINNLKKVNDEFGHKEGDNLLAGFSESLKKVFEPKGAVYRVGGDEFIVLSSEFSESNAEDAMNRLKQVSQEYELLSGPISYAYGYTIFNVSEGNDFKTARNKADKKMYEMKSRMKEK